MSNIYKGSNKMNLTYKGIKPLIGGSQKKGEYPLILEYTIASANTTISLNLGGGVGPNAFSQYDFHVDWGDGFSEAQVNYDGNAIDLSHTFTAAGTYDVKIIGAFPYVYLYGSTNKELLTDIKQWGSTTWESMNESFRGCTGLTNVTATDAPDMSGFKNRTLEVPNADDSLDFIKGDIYATFRDCSNLTNLDFMSNWDMTNVRVINQAFRSCSNLSDISAMSNWDMSKTEYFVGNLVLGYAHGDSDYAAMANWSMDSMLAVGYLVYQNNVTDLTWCENWGMAEATRLNHAFGWADNITSLAGLEKWNTGKVETIKSIFNEMEGLIDVGAIANWDTSSLTDASYSFYETYALGDVDLSGWDVSVLYNTEYMFSESGITNISMNGWQATALNTANFMFYLASDLVTVDITNTVFGNTNTHPVPGRGSVRWSDCWNGCTSLTSMIGWETSDWDGVKNLWKAFKGCTLLDAANGSPEGLTMTGVDAMYQMFYNCTSFSADLGSVGNYQLGYYDNMLNNTALTTADYGSTITGWLSNWESQDVTNMFAYNDGANYGDYAAYAAQRGTAGDGTTDFGTATFDGGQVYSGLATSTSANQLISLGSLFNTNGLVSVGDIVCNNTDVDPSNYTYSKIISIDDDNTLTLNDDILINTNTYLVLSSEVAKARYEMADTWSFYCVDGGPV